jgi:hypothetical protein
MTRHTHLSDDRLIEVALDRSPDVYDREHLDACPTCDARLDDLTRLLSVTTSAAVAEADEVFTPERLQRQRNRILQRIEHEGRPGKHEGRPGKIVNFPAGQVHHPRPARPRPGMRWVAGAAAAGIVIGMLAGHYAPTFRMQNTRSVSFAKVPPETVAMQAVSTTLSEEEFLGRLETAVDGTGGSTLQPLHELTPLAWEVSAP